MHQLPELPTTNDTYWEEAEKFQHKPRRIVLCLTHEKDKWLSHEGYKQESDGTIVCTLCPWGGRAPGYYKVIDGKIVDLRVL